MTGHAAPPASAQPTVSFDRWNMGTAGIGTSEGFTRQLASLVGLASPYLRDAEGKKEAPKLGLLLGLDRLDEIRRRSFCESREGDQLFRGEIEQVGQAVHQAQVDEQVRRLLAKPFDEATLVRTAYAYEQHRGFVAERPALT